MPGKGRVVALLFLVALGVATVAGRSQPAPVAAAASIAASVPTPGPGAMTVYNISNANATTLNVQNVISNSSGFSYTFWNQVPANSSVVVHVRDIAQVPSPFNGQVQLYADQPFTAQITGYDYPSGPAATATPLGIPASQLPARAYLPLVSR